MRYFTSFLYLLVISLLLFSCKDEDPVVTGIHLNVADLTLGVGEEYQFVISHEPVDAPAPSYGVNVSDYDVAFFDGLLLKTKKEGEVIVTVETMDVFDRSGNPFTASCRVKIDPVSIRDITLDNESYTLSAGDTVRLSYSLIPENVTYKDVLWESSDENIVKVTSEGLLVGMNVGRALIVVKSKENENIRDSCIVDILARSLDGISLDKTEISYCSVGTSETLHVNYIPEYATNKKVYWTSSNPDIATVDENGVVSMINAGTCVITATSEEGNHTATCTVTIPYIKVQGINFSKEDYEVGVGHTFQLGDEVNVYPIHASNRKFTLRVTLGADIISIDENGLVSGLKEGTAIVEAKSEDGGYRASCFITVIEAVVANVDCSLDFSSWGNIAGYLTSNYSCTIVNNNEEPIILKSLKIVASDGEEGKTVVLSQVIYPGASATFTGHFVSIYDPYYLLFFEYKGVCCYVKKITEWSF